MALIEESLRNYLDKIAGELKYVNPDITINEISSGGANYTSKLYTAVVREAGKEDLHLFAKVAVLGESMREVLPNMYTTEQYMYTTLAKWYERMEQESGVKEEDRLLFCKFYGFDPSPNREILVLENLLLQGYGPHDRFHSVDWPYAAAAVRDLAKMHALSFAFAKKYPEEFEKAVKIVSSVWDNDVMKSSMQRNVDTALNVVSPEHKDALARFMDKTMKLTLEEMIGPVGSRTVIIHRDYRGNNLLHRRREKYVNPEITIEEISSGGANYTSKLYTAVVREADKEDMHLFAKVAVISESMRSMVPNVFLLEQYTYTELAKWFETIEKESGVPEEDRLVFCKFYGLDATLYKEIMVLENLLPQGYGPHDRFHSIDWPYAAAAVRDLAKFHALSFAFAKKHPEEFEKAMKNISLDWPEEIMETMIRQAVPSAVKVVSPEHKEAFVKFMEESLKTTYFDILKPVNSKLAIIHRDYRGNNLLHRRREDEMELNLNILSPA
ncbi:hypothetical protein SFRURICE_005051 [Spodoptera frugiperda]|uniref:SFRICE_008180 n=1 Tax=Spodoptera frugiperda TaxID=7108 RepID=A0A2H1V9J1_SPOFR|nr:hypothetical protein SFRURICE_005051 [Spodoptera frugiperda]